jgi:carbon starvation protein
MLLEGFVAVIALGTLMIATSASLTTTAITCALPLLFVWFAKAGSWKYFWTLFGTSNQLLAALSLMGITVWLKKTGKRYWYALWPMLFVSAVTATSLVMQIHAAFFGESATPVQQINGAVSIVLLALAGSLGWFCLRALMQREPATSLPVADSA